MRKPNAMPMYLDNFVFGDISGVKIRILASYHDERGQLIELFRTNELPIVPVMAYMSTTKPGVQRGTHEHMTQTDVFVFLNDFLVALFDNRPESSTYGYKMLFKAAAGTRVVVPPGVVHAYKNVSDQPGVVFNAPDIPYAGWLRDEPVDEIRHEQDAKSPFNVDIETLWS